MPPQRGLTRSAICLIGKAMYYLRTTHRTCGLVRFSVRAANTSTRKCTSDTVSKTCSAVKRVYSQHKWLCTTDKHRVDC